MDAINEKDLEKFDHIKRCRNTLTHEMLTFASSGVDFDVADTFDEMIGLLRKIEMWWFVNFEMEISPENYPEDLDLEQVTPGPVWRLKMIVDIALGPEEKAHEYYDHFAKNADKN